MKLAIYSKVRGDDKAKTRRSHRIEYIVTGFGSCFIYLVGEVFLSDR